MSFDLNLPTVCDHKIYRELIELGQDRRTFKTAQPIAAVKTVQLYASEELIDDSLYDVVDDLNSEDVYRPKIIILKNAWKQIEDYFEVNYVTLSSYCPVCTNLKVIHDISFNIRGLIYLARDEKLLLQNIEKFVITELGSNPFQVFIGTSLIALLGEKVSDRGFLANRIIQEINASLNRFKDMQDQYKKSGRPVTDGELLDAVEDVKVTFDTDDPTILWATVTVRSVSGKSITYEQYMKLPEA